MADVWDADFHELRVDREEAAELFAGKYRGSIRLQLGLYCTQEEFEAERKEVLERLFS